MNNGQTTVSFCKPQAILNDRPSFKPTPNLARWNAIIAELRNPDLELDCETFAGIWREYARLKAAGYSHDPMVTALLVMLQRQMLLTDAGVEFALPVEGRAA